MTLAHALPDQPLCSFCGKPGPEVDKLVAGPGVQICNECVDLAHDIIAEYLGRPAPVNLPVWGPLTDQEMLDHIPRVAAVAEQSSSSTEQVSAATEQTSASTQQIASSAQELSATADELQRLVSQFTFS